MNMMKTYLKQINFILGNYKEIPLFSLFLFRFETENVQIHIFSYEEFYQKYVRSEDTAVSTIRSEIPTKLFQETIQLSEIPTKLCQEANRLSQIPVLWVTDHKLIGMILQAQKEAVLIYENPNETNKEVLLDKNPNQEKQDSILSDMTHFEYVIQGFEDVDLEFFERIYRRLCNIPWDILETDRLFVRESVVDDLDSFYQIYKDPSITQYMENLYENPREEREYLEAYIKNAYRFYETGIFTVILKETGEIIGRAGLDRKDDCEELELGFVIGIEHQKKGYATEVCLALLKYAKDYFPKDHVHAFADPQNISSIHVLQKIGFHQKTEREYVL